MKRFQHIIPNNSYGKPIVLSAGLKIGSKVKDKNDNIIPSRIIYDYDLEKYIQTDKDGKIFLIY